MNVRRNVLFGLSCGDGTGGRSVGGNLGQKSSDYEQNQASEIKSCAEVGATMGAIEEYKARNAARD
ncbi:MAG: hypothetical protein ACRD5Z_03655, partial [Bryobacteraceae bacterium]